MNEREIRACLAPQQWGFLARWLKTAGSVYTAAGEAIDDGDVVKALDCMNNITVDGAGEALRYMRVIVAAGGADFEAILKRAIDGPPNSVS